jgi:hypothetical protein
VKDTKKILRQAIYDALNGNIIINSLPVLVIEEKLRSTQNPNLFIILSNQYENDEERNSSTWITRSSIDIEIIHKTGSDVSKDVIDNVYNQLLEIVFPTREALGLTVPVGFQFQEGFRESCFTNVVLLSETETVITEKLKLVFIVTQN